MDTGILCTLLQAQELMLINQEIDEKIGQEENENSWNTFLLDYLHKYFVLLFVSVLRINDIIVHCYISGQIPFDVLLFIYTFFLFSFTFNFILSNIEKLFLP